MKEPVRVPGENLRPVHEQQIGEQGGVAVKQGRVHGAEVLPEGVLTDSGQTGGERLDILLHDLIFQRAGRTAVAHDNGMELVELENFGEIVELAREGHHGETGELLVLEHVIVERGEQLPAFHQRVALHLLIGAHQAVADMDGVKEALERGKIAHGQRVGEGAGIAPGVAVLAENILPANHASVSVGFLAFLAVF